MLRICVYFRNNHWEINQWSYVTSTFKVDEIFVIGPKDIVDDSSFLKNATIIDSIDDLPPGPIVLAAPKNANFVKGVVDLKDFVHPEDAIYVFGPDHHNFNEEDHLGKRGIDHKVYISNETRFEFYAHVAAGIFMYDRRVKS